MLASTTLSSKSLGKAISGRFSPPVLALCFLLTLLLPQCSTALEKAETQEYLSSGIHRYWPKGADQELHSFALENPIEGREVERDNQPLTPLFQQEETRSVAIVAIEEGTSLYGTGEVAGGLLRNGHTVETWNYDAYGYDASAKHLYQSHPWVLGVRVDGTAFGILADTTWRCRVSLDREIRFESMGPPFPLYLIEGDSPQEVLTRLASLTGTISLPPLWALGYQQCRHSYYPHSRVCEVADEFRRRKIPCDVIWMDIYYMDGFRIFTFDRNHFPNPKETNDYLHERGFHNVWMIDPGVKREEGYFVYEEGRERDAWVKTSEGCDFVGKVWPGDCLFPDFTQEHVQEWWATLYKEFLAEGIDGVWNDMNEPAVFDRDSKTMPLDNKHMGQGGGTHARFHNVYGLMMVKASREGIMKAAPNKRPFILSRANYIGGHRYAAAWTGDNSASWEHLAESVPMALSMGLSGQPFVGPDIGGFIGESNAELFARWMSIGALLPFARGHTEDGTMDHEPWSFGSEAEATCRVAIERRYRLMPYLYTLFEEASRNGLPVVRPTFFADPTDMNLRSADASFLLGSDLLVLTQPHWGEQIVHQLPKGKWRPLDLDGIEDPQLPLLHLREGALLPVGPVQQHTGEELDSPLVLYLNLDREGRASGELYEDEGEGYGYKDGLFLRRKIAAQLDGNTLKVVVEKSSGNYVSCWKSCKVVLLTDDAAVTAFGDLEKGIEVQLD